MTILKALTRLSAFRPTRWHRGPTPRRPRTESPAQAFLDFAAVAFCRE